MKERRRVAQRVGQLLTIGFKGTELTPFVRDFLGKREGGGVILFSRNLGNAEEILDLNREAREAAASVPPYRMVDQEGGPVMRLRNVATPLPPMGKIGELPGVHGARRAGKILGRELRALGFNVNCAPVLDVHSNPDNPIIGERAFSENATRVGALGEAFIRGIQAMGVLACGKHFPGHGDTNLDSHLALPTLEHDLERLREVELVPFRHVIQSAPPALMMTAHIVFPKLDPDHPATLSSRVIPELLRQELKFGGVVVSDDLEMAAIDDRYPMEEVIRLGLGADIDVFLICHEEWKQQVALETLEKLVMDGDVPVERIERSLRRIHRTKSAFQSLPQADPKDLETLLCQTDDMSWVRGFGG